MVGLLSYYAYLTGALFFLFVWLILFFLRKDLRKEMLWASLLALPFILTESFFIPEYWDPHYVFNLTSKIGFSIETLIFGFSVGGVISVIYEFVSRKTLKKMGASRRVHLFAYAAVFLMYVGLEFIFPLKTAYNVFFALVTGSVIVGFLRRDLIMQIILGGFLFSAFYSSLFMIFNLVFPNFLLLFYNLEGFWGINVFGVPLEEIMLAFAVGSFWAVLFEYVKGYKTKAMKE